MKQFLFSYKGVSTGIEWEDVRFDPVVERLHLPIWEPAMECQSFRLFRLFSDRGARPTILGPVDEEERPGRDEFGEELERRLHFYLASRCQVAAFVHAGVVAWRGRAIVLPARSYSGKSTLVVELLRCGAQYLSDEYAVVDRNGLVHPFPRPVSLRAKGGGVQRLSPSGWRFGAEIPTEPVAPGIILISRYVRNATWQPQQLSAGEAVLEMLSNTVNARSQPQLVLECLSKAADRATCLVSNRGDASVTADLILGGLSF